ncbi:hypothetical protein LCGC14_2844280, partial [marine sediment metagenome]
MVEIRSHPMRCNLCPTILTYR